MIYTLQGTLHVYIISRLGMMALVFSSLRALPLYGCRVGGKYTTFLKIDIVCKTINLWLSTDSMRKRIVQRVGGSFSITQELYSQGGSKRYYLRGV